MRIASMRSIPFSLSSRAVWRASLTLVALSTLAACDSDRAVSPSPISAKVPTSTNSALVPGGRGDFFTGSVNGDMTSINVAGSSYDLITPLGDTMHVADNGQFDSDATLGKVKVSNVLAGKYTVCPMIAPNNYAFPQTLCITTTIVAGSGANIGFLAYQAPSLYWNVRSTGDWAMLGGTYTVATLRIKSSFNVADNGPNDLDPTAGRVAVKVGGIGSYSVCESTPPAGFWPAITKCMNATSVGGGTKWVGQFTNQEKQVVYNP
jgi:hypothetical protein